MLSLRQFFFLYLHGSRSSLTSIVGLLIVPMTLFFFLFEGIIPIFTQIFCFYVINKKDNIS